MHRYTLYTSRAVTVCGKSTNVWRGSRSRSCPTKVVISLRLFDSIRVDDDAALTFWRGKLQASLSRPGNRPCLQQSTADRWPWSALDTWRRAAKLWHKKTIKGHFFYEITLYFEQFVSCIFIYLYQQSARRQTKLISNETSSFHDETTETRRDRCLKLLYE